MIHISGEGPREELKLCNRDIRAYLERGADRVLKDRWRAVRGDADCAAWHAAVQEERKMKVADAGIENKFTWRPGHVCRKLYSTWHILHGAIHP